MVDHKKKNRLEGGFSCICGRGKRIRTSGPCVPNAVLYQAELFPDTYLLFSEARNLISDFAQLQSPIIVAALP